MKVLEVNVDDLHSGGVYSLVKNVIVDKNADIKIDIGAIERFVNIENIKTLNNYNCDVYYVGYEGCKWKKQFVCFNNLRKLLKRNNYDCVHIHADVSNKLLVSALAAKSVGVKKIILHSHAAGVDGNHRLAKRNIHFICRRLLIHIGTDFVACSGVAAAWMFPNIASSYEFLFDMPGEDGTSIFSLTDYDVLAGFCEYNRKLCKNNIWGVYHEKACKFYWDNNYAVKDFCKFIYKDAIESICIWDFEKDFERLYEIVIEEFRKIAREMHPLVYDGVKSDYDEFLKENQEEIISYKMKIQHFFRENLKELIKARINRNLKKLEALYS